MAKITRHVLVDSSNYLGLCVPSWVPSVAHPGTFSFHLFLASPAWSSWIVLSREEANRPKGATYNQCVQQGPLMAMSETIGNLIPSVLDSLGTIQYPDRLSCDLQYLDVAMALTATCSSVSSHQTLTENQHDARTLTGVLSHQNIDQWSGNINRNCPRTQGLGPASHAPVWKSEMAWRRVLGRLFPTIRFCYTSSRRGQVSS